MNKSITLYFTSDLHGVFFPTSYADRTERNMGLFKCANRFKKDGNTLIIDGGDILQGSAFTSYCHSVHKSSLPVTEIMNRCQYDYVTVGNHDFNYGIDYLGSYISSLHADCVCQNLRTQNGSLPFPYRVHTMENGLRVGVTGIVTDYVNVWERPENLRYIRVTDPFSAAKEALLSMRAECDLTVCIYHGGFERDLSSGAVLTGTGENIAWRICEELSFDVLLTGHQHMPIDGQTLFGTYVLQPADNGKEFHRVTVTLADTGEKKFASERVPAGGAVDPKLYEKFLPIEERVQAWLDETVGHLGYPLLPQGRIEMASCGSGIADFLNRIQLYFTGAEVSAVSLANDIAGFNATVTRRDILSTYPYPNSLMVVEVTGAMLRAAIERSAEYFSLGGGTLQVSANFLKPKVEHYNYDYYAGIRYTIDVSRPIGQRVAELTRAGKQIYNEEKLSVCVNNYRASGGGGYPMYPRGRVLREIHTDMADLILKYFEIFPMISTAELEKTRTQLRVVKGDAFT